MSASPFSSSTLVISSDKICQAIKQELVFPSAATDTKKSASLFS